MEENQVPVCMIISDGMLLKDVLDQVRTRKRKLKQLQQMVSHQTMVDTQPPSSHTMEKDQVPVCMSMSDAMLLKDVLDQERTRKRKMKQLVRKTAEKERLENKARNEYKKREATRLRVMKKYSESEDLSYFSSDITRCDTLFVFSFCFAKVQSPKFREFIKSLTDDGSVYFGFNSSLAVSIKEETELRPAGLGRIASVLEDNTVGVLLTDNNKTEKDVLSKFGEYSEVDYVKPGDTPMETVVFEEGEVLSLPTGTSLITSLYPKLLKLGMPVEIIIGRGGEFIIKLTKRFVVCEKGECVAENAVEILKLLRKKMLAYFLMPVCRWNALDGATHFYPTADDLCSLP